jgi:hypothetical protein
MQFDDDGVEPRFSSVARVVASSRARRVHNSVSGFCREILVAPRQIIAMV